MNKRELTEQEIRSRYISPAILDAGWPQTQIREEYYHFTDGRMHIRGSASALRGKRSFVDYLLIHRNVPLAIVEAKDNKNRVGDGMQQALRYAEALDVPFVYTSNGDGFLEHDRLGTSDGVEQELALNAFPSPQALWERYTRANNLTTDQIDVVTQEYFSERGGKAPRYYQTVAINRTIQAIAKGQDRILLVMATGTGKTYTAFQIIWRLWKARRVRRVLFLADRNILVDQTMTNDFKHFGDTMTKIRKRQIDKSFEIYLALYQGMTGTEEEQNVYRQFSPDFFDLIVVDECHRGSAAADSAWREILDYFAPAVQLGLTATPKETETISNIDYFGDPVYTYSLKQGIEDGFLAPYKVLRVNLDTDVDGWRPEAGQLDKHGQLIDDREYNARDFDRTLVIDDRTQLVAQRVAEYMRATDPLQKTIVFCVDIDHAERMRQALVNAIGADARANRRFVMRITGDNDEGKLELDNFIAPEETYPVIATTSKLMTTGVDAQTCKLIVLDTIINSMTEFKQIIGRGTRLRPDLGKTHFTIIDFRNATRLFYDPDFDGTPIQADEYDPDEVLQPRAQADGNDESHDGSESTTDTPQRPTKFVVNGVQVHVLAERVQYYDASGTLVTKTFVEFSRDSVRQVYQSLDAFLQRWSATDRTEAVLAELLEQGVMLDEMTAQVGDGFDPFDLICYVAFDRPPLTRAERARKAQKEDIFTRHGETARQVLSALLDKYADQGIEALEEAAEPQQMGKVLQLEPFRNLGSPLQIVNAFGGRNEYLEAVRALRASIYRAAS